MPVPPLLAAFGTAVWRLLVAAIALWGYLLYFDGSGFEGLIFLTQSGNLLVGIGYAAVALVGLGYHVIRRTELNTAPVRGAMALLMMVVGSTYVGVMGGDASAAKDLLTHVITPTLAVIDWCFVGKGQNRTRWWHPLTWLIVPALYLVWYTATDGFSARSSWGSPIYDFMDPSDGSYVGVIIGLVAASAVCAYLLYGIAKLKGLLSSSLFASAGAGAADSGDQRAAHPGDGHPGVGQWQPRLPAPMQGPPGQGPPMQGAPQQGPPMQQQPPRPYAPPQGLPPHQPQGQAPPPGPSPYARPQAPYAQPHPNAPQRPPQGQPPQGQPQPGQPPQQPRPQPQQPQPQQPWPRQQPPGHP